MSASDRSDDPANRSADRADVVIADLDLAARYDAIEAFAGGEGTTLRVRERATGRDAILKLVEPGADLGEVSLAASLGHPQIPRVLEVGRTADGAPFLVREFIAGRSLDRLAPLAVDTAIVLAEELCEVLVFVHLRGVLHLDLKPANVIERATPVAAGAGCYALLDFGLGHRRGERSVAAGGTPFFCAPEVVLGLEPDPRSDLFSLGATLAVLLSEARPAWSRFVRRFPAEPFLQAAGIARDALPAPFDAWLPRLVAREPARRFVDAQEALEALVPRRRTGRPMVAALAPDPVALTGALLDARCDALDAGVDLELTGGVDADRQALALHAAARLGDVVRVDGDAESCRLVRAVRERAGPVAVRFEVPAMRAEQIAEHLRIAVQLDESTAAAVAAELVTAGRDRPAALARYLHELVDCGQVVPDGPRWSWPGALVRGSRAVSGEEVRDDAGLRELADRGAIERALNAYRAAVDREPGSDVALRRQLVGGFIAAGEASRALPFAHDLPLLRARALLELGRVDAARDLVEGPVDAEAEDDATLRVRLRAWLRLLRGDADGGLELLGDRDVTPRDVVLRGAILAGAGRRDAARDLLESALRELDPATAPFVRAAALSNLGDLQRDGDPARAERSHAEALELFRRLGNARHTAIASSNLGVVAKDLGRLDEAREHLRRARALFEHVGDEVGVQLADANLGVVALEAGDPHAALERITRARASLDALGFRQGEALLASHAARARAAIDADEAAAPAASAGTSETPTPTPDMIDSTTRSDTVPVAVFRTFVAVNRRLARDRDLPQVLRYLLDSAVALAGAREGYLLVEQDGRLRLELATSDDAVDRAFSRSLANRAIQQQRVIGDASALADRELLEMPSVRALGRRSVLCVPFRTTSGTAGALYVEHGGRAGVFDANDEAALEVLAEQAAIAVERAAYESALENQLRDSRRRLDVAGRTLQRRGRVRMIGDSPPMRELARQIERFARTELPLLILGETGSGKELVAQSVHEHSAVADGPFLAENCSAIPAELIESELFGHVAGAFTGADADRAGLLELASGGTLFLDEVGDMPPPMQLKLLRALQESEIRRVGGRETIPIRVRILAATHRDLQALVASGEFREDLYFRIAAGVLRVPPLRERGDDVVRIAQHVLERLNREHRREVRLGADDASVLLGYDWPGNVRELEHVVSRAFLLSDGDELEFDELGPGGVADGGTAGAGAASAGATGAWPVLTLAEAERRTIDAALRAHGGNKAKAARELGISRTALYDKLARRESAD